MLTHTTLAPLTLLLSLLLAYALPNAVHVTSKTLLSGLPHPNYSLPNRSVLPSNNHASATSPSPCMTRACWCSLQQILDHISLSSQLHKARRPTLYLLHVFPFPNNPHLYHFPRQSPRTNTHVTHTSTHRRAHTHNHRAPR